MKISLVQLLFAEIKNIITQTFLKSKFLDISLGFCEISKKEQRWTELDYMIKYQFRKKKERRKIRSKYVNPFPTGWVIFHQNSKWQMEAYQAPKKVLVALTLYIPSGDFSHVYEG